MVVTGDQPAGAALFHFDNCTVVGRLLHGTVQRQGHGFGQADAVTGGLDEIPVAQAMRGEPRRVLAGGGLSGANGSR